MKSVVTFMVVVFLWVMWGICGSVCFGQERYPLHPRWNNLYKPYEIYTRSYSPNPPKLYSDDGTYLGRLSKNRYAPDSVSNKSGRYGSRHSPDSVNNPNTMQGRYRNSGGVYVEFPRW